MIITKEKGCEFKESRRHRQLRERARSDRTDSRLSLSLELGLFPELTFPQSVFSLVSYAVSS